MNVKNELTLLTEGQVWGNDNEEQLEVLKKYGTKSSITDLVLLTGGFCGERFPYMKLNYINLKGRTGLCYTQTLASYGGVHGVFVDGSGYGLSSLTRNGAIRPVLLSSSVFSQISPNRVRGDNGTEEVEYGEYPQYAPDEKTQRILENEYQSGKLKKTGKNYTFDGTKPTACLQGFQAVTYDEYEYNGKKYTRVIANPDHYDEYFMLSNGERYEKGDYVWVEVSPVKWLIDDKTGLLVSKIGLLSGIRFDTEVRRYNGDFSTTEMKEYLDKYMSKDLFQTATLNHLKDDDLEIQSPFQKEISDILEQIKKYSVNFKNQEPLKKRINSILDDYNKKINSISSTEGITLENEETLKTGLITKLNQILQNTKNYYNNNEDFYNALNNIEQMIFLLEIPEEITLPSGVDIKKMVVMLPLLGQDVTNKVKQEFPKLSDIIDNYLNAFQNTGTDETIEIVKTLLKKANVTQNDIEEMKEFIETLEPSNQPKNEKEISLVNDIKMIVNVSLPFLNQDDANKIKQEILAILTEEKEKLDEYLKSFENVSTDASLEMVGNLEYSSLEQFELMLRTKLHPIFQNLKDKVDSRDIEMEIKNKISEMIDDTYTVSKHKIISTYLNEINSTKDRIIGLMNSLPNSQLYEAKLKEIISYEFDYTKDADEILAEVRELIISLYKLEIDIKSAIAKRQSIKETEIKVRF